MAMLKAEIDCVTQLAKWRYIDSIKKSKKTHEPVSLTF